MDKKKSVVLSLSARSCCARICPKSTHGSNNATVPHRQWVTEISKSFVDPPSSEWAVCLPLQLWEFHNSRQKAANKHSVPLSPSLFSFPHLCYIQIITLGFTSYLPIVNISYSHDYNSALSVHKHLQLLQPNHKHCGTVRRVLGEKQTVIWTNLWVSHAVALFIQWSWRSNM